MAEWYGCIPLIDPLGGAGAGGAALANESEALVAAETHSASQFGACQTVHGAIYRVVGRAAVGRYVE